MAYLIRADGTRIAYHFTAGQGPAIVFLPGYQSNMMGSKALALDAWATAAGHPVLRFDYGGCGQSGGDFEEQTLGMWCHDALLVIASLLEGQIVLVGSSLGGWLALVIAETLGSQVTALVGIAAAPDFTDWGYSAAEKITLAREGRIEQASPYGNDPSITTRALWQSGIPLQMLNRPIDITCPVRLIHGQCDPDVPFDIALQTARALRSDDVQIILVKDGDHRLSRAQDIALLLQTISAIMEAI